MKIADRTPGSPALARTGAVLTVRVGKPSAGSIGYILDTLASAASGHSSVVLQAKVDTGSFATVVPTRYVGKEGLDLKPVSAVITSTASHKGITAEVFVVSIQIEDKLRIPACYVLSLETAEDKCLIGRDLLQTGGFEYYGPLGRYVLHMGVQLEHSFSYPFWLE